LHGRGRQRRHFGYHDDFRAVLENSRPPWGLPIIGAGCCVDNEVGAAGSTGKGEENIKISGGHTIIEMMRQGKSPTDACLEAMGRIGAQL